MVLKSPLERDRSSSVPRKPTADIPSSNVEDALAYLKANAGVQPGDLATVATTGDYNDLTNKPTLGTAAAADTGDFATSAQGALADSATQPGDLAAVATSGAYSDLTGTPTLGTAAAEDATAFATAAQGTLADSALQSSDIGSAVQAYDADLTTWAGKTAPSGTVVGTSDTQTLDNKTLTSPTIKTALTITSDSGSPGIEFGRQNAVNTPFVDFRSSGNSVDYDARLKGSDGDATLGGGLLTLIGSYLITPRAASFKKALSTSQSADGTDAGEVDLNTVTIASDVAVASKINGLTVKHSFGGSATKGGRHAFRAWAEITAATASDNPDRNYVGAHMRAQASSADNGTSGSEKGAFFGMNPEAVASSGATNLLELTSGECNVAAKTGSSVKYKAGLTIVARNDDAVQGSTYDCSLGLSNQTGAVGFNDGFLFGPMNGQFPLTSSGNLMRTIGGSFANGIDLSNSTMSGWAFKSPNFSVEGDGDVAIAAGKKLSLLSAAGLSNFQMGNTGGAGNVAQIDLDPLPGDATSQAAFRFFRSTNTSGAAFITVLKGNNSSTENCRIAGNTNSFFCADNGSLGVGNNAPTSKLHVTGPIATAAPATKTADYTVTASDASIICNGSGAIALTLPAASGCAGRWLTVKTIAAQAVNSASSNVVPLVGGSAGTAILTGTAGKWARLQSDGTNWVIMEGN